MTVPDNIKPPKAVEVAAAAASAAAVRKRRRRTPAGGAADDCFTCSKRNVKCDRRRPYCSQCLEVGNECSGYKTQLTWGVGVASRGKLRGLSLPIAKAPPAAGSTSHSGVHNAAISKKMAASSAARSRAESANASLSAWMDREALAAAAALSSSIQNSPISPRRRFHDDADLYERSPALSHASYAGYEYSSIPASHALSSPGPMSVPMSVPVTIPQSSWGSASHGPLSSYSGSLASEHLSYGSHSQHPSHASHVSHASHASQQMHAAQHQLSASIDSLSDVDYMSPISHSLSREDLPYIPSPAAMIYESLGGNNSPVPQSPIAAMMMEQRPAPTSCPSLVYAPSEQDSSLTSSHSDNLDANLSAKLLRECDSMGEFLYMYAFLYLRVK